MEANAGMTTRGTWFAAVVVAYVRFGNRTLSCVGAAYNLDTLFQYIHGGTDVVAVYVCAASGVRSRHQPPALDHQPHHQ